ncbi:MAG: DUF3152 domain-containing protein [Lapillicoccus sp.]
MTILEQERGVSDRVRRRQRRQHRLRRTVVLTLVLLLAGSVLARWREDPASIAAGGVRAVLLDAALVGQNAGSSAADPLAGDAGSAAPAPSASAAAGAPPAVTGHADSDDSADQGGALGSSSALAVPSSGTGRLIPVAVPAGPVEATGRTVTYGIDVEDGLPVSPDEFATVVHAVLVDDRGWQTEDGVRFVPVSLADRAAGAAVDIRVTLASPDLTARLCAPLDTSVQQVSCWNGSRSVLNLTRWIRGSTTYADLAAYREYLVSHEVGHGLGHAHASCPAPGRPAPVMVQQTKSLEGCTAWPWPTSP